MRLRVLLFTFVLHVSYITLHYTLFVLRSGTFPLIYLCLHCRSLILFVCYVTCRCVAVYYSDFYVPICLLHYRCSVVFCLTVTLLRTTV